MKLTGACATDRGSTREINQDSIVYLTYNIKDHWLAIMAVCDGIGGLSSGETASQMVVSGIKRWFDGITEWITSETIQSDVLFAHIKDAAESWNEEIFDWNILNNVKTGTTMSLIFIVDTSFLIIQVGDSRVYSYRNNSFDQLTVDASITKLKNGKPKPYLCNYMGKDQELWFSEFTGQVEDECIFIVCSDGLYHNLRTEDIALICSGLLKQEVLEESCRRLIDLMTERGETDNISVGLLYVGA